MLFIEEPLSYGHLVITNSVLGPGETIIHASCTSIMGRRGGLFTAVKRSSMRKGVSSGRQRAKFPRKILKENHCNKPK